MNSVIPRVSAAESVLLLVDVQSKLIAHIPQKERLIRNIRFLATVAREFEISLLATEQYPQGLGATVPELAALFPAPIPAKTSFSCTGCLPFRETLDRISRKTVVVTGMETHVCIAQTVLDLREQGWTVFIPVDAVAARYTLDHDVALSRLAHAGAILTTVEAVAFEWLRDAAHPRFKAVSRLVVERAAEL
ncbi:MAG: hydrolase [Bacteroidales bacterium]|nr:hydrolase [Bacteroidales bacterium]